MRVKHEEYGNEKIRDPACFIFPLHLAHSLRALYDIKIDH
jgi:hypothetical protein